MRERFLQDVWSYEIHDTMETKKYGFRVEVYKNNKLVYYQGGLGSILLAQINARDYFLLHALNIEREY